jgi:glycosyltransferase involved in cell wall biosynthesis
MLAILTTHPIQYQVPLWQALARDGRIPFEVWYLTKHGTQQSFDREFGMRFAWDIDTLSGYPHRFLDVAEGAAPGSFIRCRLKERLRERVRERRAVAVWIQGWQVAAYWQAVTEARAAGAEVWIRGESNDLGRKSGWRAAVRRARLRWLFSRVDRFFYIGAANRRLYEQFEEAGSRLYETPYAVDNDRFARQAARLRPYRTEIRRQWGIAQDAFCVLFCGKFIEKKRPLDLVAAAQRLQGDGELTNLHLLFTGSGELGTELRRACSVAFDAEAAELAVSESPGTRPRASFTGFLNQTEISNAYVAADKLVLPSDHGETWGLVVNEALASGLPCLVSNACGCAQDLGGDNTFVCGNIESLASKLLESGVCPPGPQALPTFSQSISAIVSAYNEAVERHPASNFF